MIICFEVKTSIKSIMSNFGF